jgi:hypothetical protein
MNDDVAKQIVGLLIDALEAEAKKHLPDFVKEQWLMALTSLIEKGLYHAWLSVIQGQVIHIQTDILDIIDERTGGGDA